MNVIIGNKQNALLQGLSIDIIKSLEGEFAVEDIVEQFKNFFYQRMILDITALKDYTEIKTLQTLSISLDMSKLILLLDNVEESYAPSFLSKLISMGIYNFTRNGEGIMYLYNNPNGYRDVAQYHQLDAPVMATGGGFGSGCRVIGIKSLSDQAGATTLTYMMLKQLHKAYDVIAVEVNSSDSKFFNDKNFISMPGSQLSNYILQNNKKNIILVDVRGDNSILGLINEMIYLVEPSTIKLNKLLYTNRNAFKDNATHRIVLNKSLLSEKDITELEYEVKVKFGGNIPPLNERNSDINELNHFLAILGFPV